MVCPLGSARLEVWQKARPGAQLQDNLVQYTRRDRVTFSGVSTLKDMDDGAHHVFKGKFRFQDLKIWQEAISLTSALFQIADTLEGRKHFRFADQLRGVALGMPNNIAESTGTSMKGEQVQLLRYARRECFEAANMLIILEREGLVEPALTSQFFARLDLLSRSIHAYMKAIAKDI